MTQAPATEPPTDVENGLAVPWSWPSPTAFATLYSLSLEGVARGKRLLVLALLFLLPTAIALLTRYFNDNFREYEEAQEVLVFYMITNALIPFSALVLASGLIQDEVEDQTLTYLMVRPLPKWSIYVAKLLAVTTVAAALAAVFSMITLAAIHYGRPEFWGTVFQRQALRIAALLALASAAYCAIFGALSLLLRRSMIVGVAYIILFEGLFANVNFVVRKATVMYYTRVLAERWLGLHVPSWSIAMDEAPSGRSCLLILLAAIVVSTILAAAVFTYREFRLKTPEGN